MNNNVTGFNSYLAKRNIADFMEKSKEVSISISKTFKYLYEELSAFWNSPNAISFFEEYTIKIQSIEQEFKDYIDNIEKNALRAYNTVAEANGADRISVDNVEMVPISFSLKYHQRDDELIGMNIPMVKDEIMPNFNKKVDVVYEELNKIPISIALYDDENSQVHAYSTNISQFKEKMKVLFENIKSELNHAIETETENLLVAKNKAVNELTD